jgi:MFS family permease
MIFVPLYVRQTFKGTSLLTIASVLAVPALTRFIASNFWGALADFTKKLKPFVIIGLAGHVACLVGLSASSSALSAVLTASAASLFYAAVTPISLSYVTLLRETEKGRAVGDLMVFQSLGWFVGGIACAYLFDPKLGIPVHSVLLGSAAMAAVVLVVVAVKLGPFHLRRSAGEEEIGVDLRVEPTVGGPGAGPRSGLAGDRHGHPDENRREQWSRAGENRREQRGSVDEDHGGRRSCATDRGGGWAGRLLADLNALYQSKALAVTFLLVGATTAGVWVYFGNFSVYMTEYIKGSTGAVGWVMALSALFGMLSLRPAGKLVDKFGSVRVLLVAILAYVATYGLVSLTVSPIFVSVLLCVPVYPPFNVSSAALVSELSGESRRAGGLGILNGVSAVSLAIGSLVGGAIGDAFGLAGLPRWTLGVEIVTFLAAVVLVVLLKTLPLNAGRGAAAGSR